MSSSARLRGAVPCAGALLLAGVASAADAQAQSVERRTISGAAAVYNLAGSVRVVPGTGRDVVIEVTRRGPDAAKLRVEQGAVRGREAVRVVFPDDDVVFPALGRSTRVRTRVNRDGTFGDGGNRGFFSSDEIEIRSSGRGTEAWADVTVAVPAGQRLDVHLVAGEASVANVDGDLSIDVHAATVTTERTRGHLAIDAGSGRVRILGAQGDITLDAGSGAVEVRDLSASSLKVDAGSGAITGGNVAASELNLDVGSGDVRLERVTARDVRVDGGSGGVDLGLASDVDDVRIDVGSGGVTLRLPPSLGATLDVETGSGGIETEVPIEVTRRERDHLSGRIGDGRGHIDIDGGSGRIRLLKN